MKRPLLAGVVALLLLFPMVVSAHDVPDLVRIAVFLKPENGRMSILVRMPANALIDFIFPLIDDSLLDLTQAESVASEGARVWIADMLSLYENGVALPRPQLLAVRIGRPNDPYFNSYQAALNHVNGDRISTEALLTQDQATDDALLETPIASPNSNFSFQPRFARVGVVVNTTLTFLPPGGGSQQFQYDGDPKTFELNPTAGHVASRFLREGVAHYFSAADYLLFILCVALAFRLLGTLVPFAVALVLSQSIGLMASLWFAPSTQWFPVLCGVLVAAGTVYMGIEAIASSDGKRDTARIAIALGTGLLFGAGFWCGLQPILQFGGSHPVISGFSFDAGVLGSELLALGLIFLAVQLLSRLSHAPRAAVIIVAAIAIHVSWHRMLDRTYALTLVPYTAPVVSPATLTLIVMAIVVALGASTYYLRRKDHQPSVQSAD